MYEIVLLSGRICTGKSGLAGALRNEFGYEVIKTSDLLKDEAHRRGVADDRQSLQLLGDQLDAGTKGEWVFAAVRNRAHSRGPKVRIVVDNIRTREQLESFRGRQDLQVTHVHLYASLPELQRRYEKRRQEGSLTDIDTYASADVLKDDRDVQFFKLDADVRINVARTDTRDNLVRVAARLGLYSPPDVRCVDVVVG